MTTDLTKKLQAISIFSDIFMKILTNKVYVRAASVIYYPLNSHL